MQGQYCRLIRKQRQIEGKSPIFSSWGHIHYFAIKRGGDKMQAQFSRIYDVYHHGHGGYYPGYGYHHGHGSYYPGYGYHHGHGSYYPGHGYHHGHGGYYPGYGYHHGHGSFYH